MNGDMHASGVSAFADDPGLFVEVNGIGIHYRIRKSGNPVLLFLHGSFLSMRSWRFVFGPLADRYTVIAIDRPAFGGTERPVPVPGRPNPYSPEGQTDLIAALLDRLGFDKAVLVGNSTGGTIALLAALRYPDRVSGLVLADPMVYSGYATSEFPSWLYPVFRKGAPVGELLAGVMIRLAFGKLHRLFWYDPAMPDKTLLGEYRADMMQGRWQRGFWELLLSSHDLGLDENLCGIGMPVLVMTGKHDRMVNPEETRRLAAELPNAELSVFEACGHLPQEEQPARFIEEVGGFLERHFR